MVSSSNIRPFILYLSLLLTNTDWLAGWLAHYVFIYHLLHLYQSTKLLPNLVPALLSVIEMSVLSRNISNLGNHGIAMRLGQWVGFLGWG